MNSRLAPLADIYRTNTRIFHLALADLGDGQTRSIPATNGNCALWIAGHAAASRSLVAKLVGADSGYPFGEEFLRGQKPKPEALPLLGEVKAYWDTVSERILARFPQLTDDDLNVEADGSYPVEDKTLLGALAFLALHDSYHMGQLGYLRTVLGKAGFAG